MKPAWDKLMEEFKDSTTALVGDVDCTVYESLCSKYKVEGFPIIKWGKIGALKDYEGERELEDLRKFATENLGPVCGPKSLNECDETQKKMIEDAMKLKDDDLKAKLKEKEDLMDKIEKEFDEASAKLEKDKNDKVKELKAGGLSAFKMVWEDRHPPPPPPPPEDEGDEGEAMEGDDADGDEKGDGSDESAGKEDL